MLSSGGARLTCNGSCKRKIANDLRPVAYSAMLLIIFHPATAIPAVEVAVKLTALTQQILTITATYWSDMMAEQQTEARNVDITEMESNANWVRTRYMKNQRDEQFLDVLEETLSFPAGECEPALPALFGRHEETRGVMVTAPSGEGKTTLIERNLDQLPGLGFFDGGRGSVISVSVLAEATLKGVAVEILHQTGYEVDGKKLQVAEAWETARHRMAILGISVLWIDEAHHLLTSGPGRETTMVLRRLKSLLQGKNALVVVLSGIPELAVLLSRDQETDRRFFKLKLDPIHTVSERRKLQRFIQALCEKSGVGEVQDPDFNERLHMAANGSLGVAIDLVSRCIARAHDKGDTQLKLHHFRRAYRLSGWAGTVTPFDDDPWETLQHVMEELTGEAV
jgi:type II secretory pathway predicted ATPase ExeA